MRHTLPVGYPSGSCVLVPVDVTLVPLMVETLSPLLEARLWTVNDYLAGYYAVSEVIAHMTSTCLIDFAQEIRDLRGVKPEFASTPVEERTSDMYNDLNTLFAQLLELRGIMDDGWFTDTYTTLKDVVQAQRGTNQAITEENWHTISDLLTGGASVVDIAAEIGSLLTNTAETAVEGGLLSTLVALTAANSAMMAANAIDMSSLLLQINGILFALRGATPPTDNVLLALRGTTDADETRNIISELE